MGYRTGQRIKFSAEKQSYIIKAANDRYLICTKPFNLEKTLWLYTIVDLQENIRETGNLIFGMGAKADEQCREMLERIVTGDTKISYRNRVALDIQAAI